MSKYRRLLGFLFLALVVFSTSVFLFGEKTYAQEVQPLRVNEQIIEEKSQVLVEKSNKLEAVSEEAANLENRKKVLLEKLDKEKRAINSLSKKLADKKAAVKAEKKRLAKVKKMFVRVKKSAPDSAGNLYGAGYCTWYVKNKRPDIPNNLGNANTWYYMAQSQGWSVGSAPKKGAIGTTTRGSLGHVVYVEGVSLDGLTVTISEMNYNGPYSLRTRVTTASEFVYIYELN